MISNPELPSATKLSLGEWAIPLVLLNVLFLAFVVVQVAVLFSGHDHVLETAGLTYAEYARQGFWQLIAAATLTLAVIATALRVAEVRRNSHRLLRALLGSLCVLTIVIVASALHRLSLYEDAFGLTRSRLAAETFSWGLGGLFVLVLAADAVRLVRAQLVRITVGATALGLLAFSLSNPDGRIAQRNIDRWRHGRSRHRLPPGAECRRRAVVGRAPRTAPRRRSRSAPRTARSRRAVDLRQLQQAPSAPTAQALGVHALGSTLAASASAKPARAT